MEHKEEERVVGASRRGIISSLSHLSSTSLVRLRDLRCFAIIGVKNSHMMAIFRGNYSRKEVP